MQRESFFEVVIIHGVEKLTIFRRKREMTSLEEILQRKLRLVYIRSHMYPPNRYEV
jgi:hypothetical protein